MFSHRLSIVIAALWWGSLGAIGFLAVPLLFAHLPTPTQAGQMAAQLFAAQTAVSVACGLALLMLSRAGTAAMALRRTLPWLLAGMILALLGQFGAAPHIAARDRLPLWHAVGSTLYVLQWLCALVVLWQLGADRAASPPENSHD